MTDIGSLGGFASGSAINSSGQIVGNVDLFSGEHSNFLYSNGTLSDLGNFGTADAIASGINDNGEIVGWGAGVSPVLTQGFLYTNGTTVNIGSLGGQPFPQTLPRGINNSGQIVGVSSNNAFLYSNGVMTNIQPGGAAWAINSGGQIVGGGPSGAFLWTQGVTMNLGTLPGTTTSLARAINDAGQVVGESDFTSGARRGFIYYNGAMSDLGVFGDCIPTGINNSGQVVGEAMLGGSGSESNFTGFLLNNNGGTFNLNDLLDSSGSGYVVSDAVAINSNGWIVANGNGPHGSGSHAFLLTPVSGFAQPLSLGNAIADQSNRIDTFGSAVVATVPVGGEYALLSSTVVGGNGVSNPTDHSLSQPLENTTAITLGGTNMAASAVIVSMAWRGRTTDEVSSAHGGTPAPPLAYRIGPLVSDVVDLLRTDTATGSQAYDPFVLQMNYDAQAVSSYLESDLRLFWLDPNSTGGGAPLWVDAFLGNTANNATKEEQGYRASFGSFQSTFGTNLSDYMGAWGIDQNNSTVWAVVDHNGEFAVAGTVPEPSTLALALVVCVCFAVRKMAGRRICNLRSKEGTFYFSHGKKAECPFFPA